MTDITGKFQLTSSENFDEYLSAIGISFIKRNAAKVFGSSVMVDITKSGDEYKIKATTPVKTCEVAFTLDQTVPETTMDGRIVQSTFHLEGSVLKQKQIGENGFESTIDREFRDGELIATARYKDVVSVRKYKKTDTP